MASTDQTIGFGPDASYICRRGRPATFVSKTTTAGRRHAHAAGWFEAWIFATGLRNSVRFDWAPWDDALYATDNRRDLLGDDTPPDELDRIEQQRLLWLAFRGTGIRDPLPVMATNRTSSVHRTCAHFRPHNAPLESASGEPTAAGYERTAWSHCTVPRNRRDFGRLQSRRPRPARRPHRRTAIS
jgi:hypothetical protein